MLGPVMIHTGTESLWNKTALTAIHLVCSQKCDHILKLIVMTPSLSVWYHRCSSQYTSVTMTSILLRFPLPLRLCARMWWSCARSRGRRTASCLRCGVDLVSNGTSHPSVFNDKQEMFNHTAFCLWNIALSQRIADICFSFVLLMKGKLLFQR